MQTTQTPISGTEQLDTLDGPHRALAEFYKAFNNRDPAAMASNWARDDDIAMDNPVGGIVRGWPEIAAVYERIFRGAARVQVEFHDYTIHEAGDVFYAVGRERGELQTGDTSLRLAIRTTRVFRKLDGRWRQVHHHGSMDDPKLLQRYQDALGAGSSQR